MHTISSIACCLLAVVVTGAAVAQDINQENEVRAAVERFGQAYRDADVDTLKALLTRDYVHVNGNSGSRIDREQWLAWVASQRDLLDEGELLVEAYQVYDVQVDLYGSTAIVTGSVRSNGIRSGEAFSVNVRFTNVWIKQDGVWRRAAFHDSPIL